MAYKFYGFKRFDINKNVYIECQAQGTSYGFRHLAELKTKNAAGYFSTDSSAKSCYYNRTWESYEYETVINKVIDGAACLTDRQKKLAKKRLKQKAISDINKEFSFVGAVAKMGEILAEDQKSANDWKARMLKAGLSGIDMPADWEDLSEDEKTKRLDKVIAYTQKAI